MRLDAIVGTWTALSATRSRKQKTALLSALLADTTDDELRTVVSWLSGELTQGKIGVGYAMAYEAAKAAPADASSLTMDDLQQAFVDVRDTKGKGSKARKADTLAALFGAATADEQRFLAALLTGELRQGSSEGMMAEGIAAAMDVPSAAVRRAAMLSGDLRAVALAARQHGEAGLDAFRVTLFRPLQPMLAQTADGPAEALATLGPCAFEAKLDGARVQVHREGDTVRVFTRHLREVTWVVPEVVDAALGYPSDRFILDGEVLALDAGGRPHPFQVTMRRFGRKLGKSVAALRDQLPLTPFFFDCLLLGDDELIDRPATERVAALASLVPETNRVARIETGDVTEAEAFLEATYDAGHEGVMAKDPASPYAAGARGAAWRKIKQVHTLDLVVVAAEWGSGRRQGWLSNLHLAAPDPESGELVMLGKTFKGLTDALLTWQTEQLLARETHREGHVVHVRPELVVEIAFQDLQVSPRYPGGLALRLARVKRYREDKSLDDADTMAAVRALAPT